MDNVNIDLIRGHMDTIILRVLENNDKYGLEILNEIKSLSKDLYSLKQPTLYNSLKRLEKLGYISSYPGQTSNGAQRVYYSLTEQGKLYLLEDQRQWEFSRTIIDRLLSDKEFDINSSEKPFEPSDFRPLTKRTKEPKEEISDETNNYDKPMPKEKINSYYSNASEELATYLQEPNYINEEQNTIVRSPSEEISALEKLYGNTKVCDNSQEQFYDIKVFQNVNEVNTLENINDVNTLKKDYNVYEEKNSNAIVNDTTLEEKMKIFDSIINPPKKLVVLPSDANVISYDNKEKEVSFMDSNKIENEEKSSNFTFFTLINSPQSQNTLNENKDTNDNNNQSINYISSFDNIYKTKVKNNETIIQEKQIKNIEDKVDMTLEEMNFVKLKNKLFMQNIKLKQYIKNNTSEYYVGRFYYSNKLFRDCSLILFILFTIFSLTSHFCSTLTKQTSLIGLLIVIGLSLLIPIYSTLKFLNNPLKRKRTSFNLSHALLSSFVILLGGIVLIILAGFFIFSVDITDLKTLIVPIFIPLASLLFAPLSVIIYAILYNSKRYHLS